MCGKTFEKKILNQTILFYLPNILIPLIVGAILYLWIKPNAWCSELFYKIFPIEKPRAFESTDLPIFGSFVKHQLCDCLFAYSMTFAMIFVLRNEKRGLLFACGIAALFETLFELAQLWGFPGNFTPIDILAEVAITMGIFLCMIIKQNKKRRNQK